MSCCGATRCGTSAHAFLPHAPCELTCPTIIFPLCAQAVMEMLGLRAASMSLRAHRGIGTVVRQLRVMRRDRLREKRQQARVEALLRRRFRLPGSGAAAPVPAAAGPAGVTPVRARRRAAFQAQSLELGSRKGTAIAGRAEGAHGQQEGAQRPARSSGSSKSRRK